MLLNVTTNLTNHDDNLKALDKGVFFLIRSNNLDSEPSQYGIVLKS